MKECLECFKDEVGSTQSAGHRSQTICRYSKHTPRTDNAELSSIILVCVWRGASTETKYINVLELRDSESPVEIKPNLLTHTHKTQHKHVRTRNTIHITHMYSHSLTCSSRFGQMFCRLVRQERNQLQFS